MDEMDRLILQLRLAQAQEDIVSSARLVNEQRNRVAALERLGRHCAEERETLAYLERVEAAHTARCDRLRRRLDDDRE